MSVEFKKHKLDNGLTIIAEVNNEAHTAAAGFFVRTGSRDETTPLMGVSHFLEHMMFKGTDRRTAEDVNQDFDLIGANYNASTSQEVTNYFAQVLPEYIDDALDILCDILRPTLRVEDFDMEKNVILEEIGMYHDRPFWVAYEQAMEQFFGDHTLGHRVLGTNESIEALSRDQMADYFAQRYSPDNMIVSLAGKVDFEHCVEQIEKHCGSWTPSGTQRNYQPVSANTAEQTISRNNTTMHYVVGLSDGPSSQDESRYAAAVLAHILGDNDGSRLYWELIDPGLAEEADLLHHPFDQAGLFMHCVSCQPDKAEQVESIFDRVLSKAAKDLTDDEVNRASAKIAMSLTLQQERPMGRMLALGGQWLALQQYRSLDEELKRIQKVSVADMQSLVEQFPFTNRTVVRMKPDGD